MGMSGCLEECVRVKGGRWLLPGILLDEAASPGILEQVTSSISDDNPTESSGRRCALPTMASPARLKPTLCAVSTWVHASTTPLRPPPGGSIDFFTMDAIVIRFLFQGLLCFLIFSGGPLCNMVAVMFNIMLVVKKKGGRWLRNN
jgi:hypothetical protein